MHTYTVYITELYVHADGHRELNEFKIAEGLTEPDAIGLVGKKLSEGHVASMCLDDDWDDWDSYEDGYDHD